MLLLSLFWLLIGVFIGGLACVARLQPVIWARDGLVSRLVIGALTALLGGWLGTLVFGKLFATAAAVWVAVLGVVLLPRLVKILLKI